MASPEDQERDNGSSENEDSTSTRRQVLKLAGGLGGALALGAAGWTGRTIYLTAQRERTSLGNATLTGSRVSGPSAGLIPEERLLSTLEQHSSKRSDVGLQATVALEDDTTWTGVAGNADHDDDIPLSFDFHLYIGV